MAIEYQGRMALITGASTGIGAEFAKRLAARGADLVLVARSEEKLEALATRLRSEYGTAVTVIPLDLAVPGAAASIVETLENAEIAVDILVNNAGFGIYGDNVRADPGAMDRQVQLNVGALTSLTTRLLPVMVARRRGVIVNIASTAAFQATPHFSAYGATKAFVLSYTRGLWAETRGTGVRVLAVCPGATQTPFFDMPGGDAVMTKRRSPEQIVSTALRALDGSKPSVVDGWMNAIAARVGPKISTERLLILAAEKFMRPRA